MGTKIFFLLLFLTTNSLSKTARIQEIAEKLWKVLNFVDLHYEEMNVDGLFGITLAQVQLQLSLLSNPNLNEKTVKFLYQMITICKKIHKKILPLLPDTPDFIRAYKANLINVDNWLFSIGTKNFRFHKLKNLGIYTNWTSDYMLQHKKARYKGVRSDECFREILELSNFHDRCYVSPFCKEMMLDKIRVDTGYLLTHRLLYLQILRLKGCTVPNAWTISDYSQKFCSLIWKEAKTNEWLNFVYHDIFLEQVVFCGLEGYAEFLKGNWLKEILDWQNGYGCYESLARTLAKRTSNTIAFGCSDHSTGLGAAALALNLRFVLAKTLQMEE